MELEDDVVVADAAKWWWVFLVGGVVWLMLGFVVLRLNLSSVQTVGYLIGMMFVLATVNEAMIASASNGAWKFLHYAMAVLFVFGAVWAFANPAKSVFTLASVIGFLLFFQGALTLTTAIGSKGTNPLWGLGLAVGIMYLLLAFWASQAYIAPKVALILVWVGMMALFRGIEHIALAFAVRHAGRAAGEMAAA